MEYLIGSALLAVLLTVGVCRYGARRWPGMSGRRHVLVSASAFPMLAVLAFVVAVVVTLAQASPQEPGGSVGMVIFAMVFFLFYALCIGVLVGIPTAIIMRRVLRRSGWRAAGEP
ncbi:hypothetical protein [Sphingobium sp.]|uniref:hypothetical protein n=1 Tax=Sphingobium sp. TaxID=1912891 RepID=UPI003BB56A17